MTDVDKIDELCRQAKEIVMNYYQAQRDQRRSSRIAISNSRKQGLKLFGSSGARRKNKWAKAPVNACPVFQNVYNAFPDTDEPTRWALADSYCKQADKYKIANADEMNLTQLMNAIKDAVGGQKQAYLPENDKENPSSDGPGGVKDKPSPASTMYTSVAECQQKLASDYPSIGTNAQAVEDYCQRAFGNGGPSKYSKSSKVRQATIALEEYESKVPDWILASRFSEAFKNHQGLLAHLRDVKEQEKTIQTNIKNAAADTTPYWVKMAQMNPYHKAMSEIRDDHEKQHSAYNNIKSGSASDPTEKAIPSSENIPYWIKARLHILGENS